MVHTSPEHCFPPPYISLYIYAAFACIISSPTPHSENLFFFLTPKPVQQPHFSNHHLHLYRNKMKSAAALYYRECEQPHFLESCFLCNKTLSNNSDIFMYRGNTPFCSQECRQEQIEFDEGNEKRWKASSSKRSKTNSTNKSSANSTNTLQTGSIAVA